MKKISTRCSIKTTKPLPRETPPRAPFQISKIFYVPLSTLEQHAFDRIHVTKPTPTWKYLLHVAHLKHSTPPFHPRQHSQFIKPHQTLSSQLRFFTVPSDWSSSTLFSFYFFPLFFKLFS